MYRQGRVSRGFVLLTHVNSAYEISTYHKREPPPKEILEDVTAKGGDLLNRTVEDYWGSSGRQADDDADEKEGDGSPEQQKTPSGDKMEVDEAGSTGGRVTRGMCACIALLCALLLPPSFRVCRVTF